MSQIDTVDKKIKNYFHHISGPSYVRILDTPHVWGMPFSDAIMDQAWARQKEFERAIIEIVQKSRYRCDLSSLNCPDPDWGKVILGAIDTAMSTKMGRKKPTQFRFLFGQTPMVPVGEPDNFTDFKAAIVRLFRERAHHWEVQPEIWMGRFYRLADGISDTLLTKIFGSDSVLVDTEGTKMTWNHSKIIAMDGTEALAGGHNLNMDLFRSYPPVHDVSVVVHGEAAHGAQLYLDQMWAVGKELMTKEVLDTKKLTWKNKDSDKHPPADPLTGSDGKKYMESQQKAIVDLHKKGKQSGKDPKPPKVRPEPKSTKDKDLQVLEDLKVPVFEERVKYNTYENFEDYKLATRMMTVGKYWTGTNKEKDFQKASEIMKETLIKGAKKTIKMSQMDLVSAWKKNWSDHVVCQWVLEALLANEQLTVEVVVSPLDAGAGAEGDQYSFGSGASRTFDLMHYYMTHEVKTDKLIPDKDGKRAAAIKRLSVAPLYFTDKVPASKQKEGDTYKWPGLSKEGYTATLKQLPLSEKPPKEGVIGSAVSSVIKASGAKGKVPSAPGNHAKIMIVDDEAYVVGSDNLYPGFLSEFNYLVEGKEALKEMLDAYWKPLWKYSGPHKEGGGSFVPAPTPTKEPSLNQFVYKSGNDYQYGYGRAIPNMPIIDFPSDADYSKWAMLHDGKDYRLYIWRKGSNDTFYQGAYNRSKKAYQYGYRSIKKFTLSGMPSDASSDSFAMLHDGSTYRLYLRNKKNSAELIQFGFNRSKRTYVWGYKSIKRIGVTKAPKEISWDGWGMLHDGKAYRLYQWRKGKQGKRFYQAAFNGRSYEFGYRSIPELELVGAPSNSDPADFGMLYDGKYRFYLQTK